MTSIARLIPLLLAAFPAAALAESPAGDAIPVVAVPAYAPGYAIAAPGLAAPGMAPAPLARAFDQAPVADSEPVGLDRRLRDDRVPERGYLTPTALVAPRGTTTVTIQAPIAPGASVRIDRSFSDRLSLGVGMVGIASDQDLIGIPSLHGKYQLWRSRRAALAATVSMYNVPADNATSDLGSGGTGVTLFMPGASASMCTADDCRTLVTVDVEALAGVSDTVLPIVGGVSIATGFKRQLIAEVHTTTADGDRLWLGFVGGRFLGKRLAFDAGFGFAGVSSTTTKATDCIDVCPISDSGSSSDIVPYPFIALSSRL